MDTGELHALIERGDGADRAFVDAKLRMAWARTHEPARRAELADLHRALRRAGVASHARIRARIEEGTLRGRALRETFDAVPVLERDHFVEEVLGIAYPPLDEHALEPELVPYQPSGYDEIVYAFDATSLGPRDRFVDIGAGLGKAVLLAELMTGARSSGVELDASLTELAVAAARELGARAQLRSGDARSVAIDDADVVFMFIPFTGQALTTVLDRLLAVGAPRARPRFLCAGAIDTSRYPALALAAPARSWLHVYSWSGSSRGRSR